MSTSIHGSALLDSEDSHYSTPKTQDKVPPATRAVVTGSRSNTDMEKQCNTIQPCARLALVT